MKKKNSERYFAAANTCDGFVSYYDKIFSKLDKLYVIKGGPGTGKSSLMRELGTRAENHGNSVEYFYCSFDPDSLDGLIINGCVGVIDGTAPHVYEPRISGALDETVDLSVFWDGGILNNSKKQLKELNAEKSRCFKLTYIYLASLGKIYELNRGLLEKCFKRNTFASDMLGRLSTEHMSACGRKLRIKTSFGRKGISSFPTYNDLAEKTICFSDGFDTLMSSDLLFPICRECKRKGVLKTYSYSPFEKGRPNAIMLSDNTAIISECDIGDYDVSEFMSREFSKMKNMLAENREIKNTLLACAEAQLKKTAEIHSEIEKIYISAMDFDAKEKFTEELVKKIIFC